MTNTCNNVLLLEVGPRLSNQFLVAHVGEPHHLPGSCGLEVGFELGEHQLDGVPLRRVPHVEDPAELQLLHLLLRRVAGVGAEVVHEEADLLIRIGSSQAGEVLLELVRVDGLLEDLVVFQAVLLRDAGQQRKSRLVQVGLVYAHVLLRPRPLDLSDRLAGHHRFVDVVDLVPLVPVPGQQPLHVDEPLSISFWVRILGLLGPLEPLLLDAMFPIYDSQQRRVHMSRWELALELG